MRSCRPVLHRLRLAVRLMPDNVGTQIPAILLKRERKFPWNADEVLGLQTLRCWRAICHTSGGIFFISMAPGSIATGISVSDVQPERTIGFQNSSNFSENRGDMTDILVEIHFSTDLIGDAVVSQPPVRRTRDTTAEGFVRDVLQ
jgi:hypothetical protein